MTHYIEKADGTLVLLVHLSLKPGRDDPMITLIRSTPKRGLAGIIREAMRTGITADIPVEYGASDEIIELPDIGIEL
jgi:hypothetical protein